ncbi:hypothetical protein C9I57_03220 [Trinickia symbiotica]|uniref:Uncharacterized protein n=1 Tax=Trinickia symbiotica TaxID=863227 RepID=A0A2T3Y1Z4_9BURK|nr:hypothetical protein [Trinickia symbiotica]PTB22772.1 hypothetical protein C9I57_03220 [Trinickia symbiotica]
MADSAASSTSGLPRPATTKRRARAASSETDNRPARAALSVEEAVQTVGRAAEGAGAAVEKSVDLVPADETLAVAQMAHTMNLDPRQGTLDGFELPAEALSSLREREEKEPTRPVSDAGDSVAIEEAAVKSPSGASSRRQAIARKSTEPAARGANVAEAADASSQRAYDALTQSVAALQAALVDERRTADESRRRIRQLVVAALAISLLVGVLSVVQTVVALRASEASAAAEQKTAALLRAQQTELAAFVDAASAASADIRDASDSLDAKLTAPPARASTAAPIAGKHAPRPTHPRKTAEKVRGSSAY